MCSAINCHGVYINSLCDELLKSLWVQCKYVKLFFCKNAIPKVGSNIRITLGKLSDSCDELSIQYLYDGEACIYGHTDV